MNRRRVAFAKTSVSCAASIIVSDSGLALYTKLPGGGCLRHIGREGSTKNLDPKHKLRGKKEEGNYKGSYDAIAYFSDDKTFLLYEYHGGVQVNNDGANMDKSDPFAKDETSMHIRRSGKVQSLDAETDRFVVSAPLHRKALGRAAPAQGSVAVIEHGSNVVSTFFGESGGSENTGAEAARKTVKDLGIPVVQSKREGPATEHNPQGHFYFLGGPVPLRKGLVDANRITPAALDARVRGVLRDRLQHQAARIHARFGF